MPKSIVYLVYTHAKDDLPDKDDLWGIYDDLELAKKEGEKAADAKNEWMKCKHDLEIKPDSWIFTVEEQPMYSINK